ncbi:MAG TPA: hypothetical protein VEB66_06370 [Opitutaceae bacterium]|nr:hypothetical protein [Opitutaceae bacterium]
MISWIQKYFQKHFKWLFILLLGCTIVSFVVITNVSSGLGTAGPKRLTQPFFGYDLAHEDDKNRIGADAEFSVYMKAGYPFMQGAQFEQYAFQRVAALALADQLRLPPPTEAQLSTYIAGLALFQNQQGQFDAALYQRFGDSLKGNARFTTADATRVMRDDYRIDQLQKLLGGPGYVLPEEVRDELVNADSAWTIQVASADYAAFNPNVAVTEDAIARFYQENLFRYQVPERRRLSIVEFKAADHGSPGAPTEEQLRNFYNANPARFPVPPEASKGDAPALGADATADNFPKVRAQVEAALREEVGVTNASRAANAFTVALYRSTAANRNAELGALVAATGVKPVDLPPFTPLEPPAGLEWTQNYLEEISRLDAGRRISDALRSPTGYAVFLWHETLPPYQPELANVRTRVEADYRESEKAKRFAEHGRALKARLGAAVKAGTPFEKAAADAQLAVATHANFTFQQPPAGLPSAVFEALLALPVGEVTDMLLTREGKGVIVHLQERKLPDATPANPRFAETKARLAQFGVVATGNAILADMVAAERKKHAPVREEPAP